MQALLAFRGENSNSKFSLATVHSSERRRLSVVCVRQKSCFSILQKVKILSLTYAVANKAKGRTKCDTSERLLSDRYLQTRHYGVRCGAGQNGPTEIVYVDFGQNS